MIQAEERVLQRAYESLEYYLDRFVNPNDAFEGWMDVTPLGFAGMKDLYGPSLQHWRNLGRRVAFSNPFAINGHNNIANFTVGTGMAYKITDRKERTTFTTAIEKAHDYWEQFVEDEKWDEKEREIVTRSHRDGECLIRIFPEFGATATVRFIDPDDIESQDPRAPLGVLTAEGDGQHVLGYYVNNNLVPADEILMFKKNTDSDVLRGIPTFLPVIEPLERAKKMLRVMAKMAEIQAAIAVVREHPEGTTGTKIAALANAMAQRTPTDGTSGESFRQRQIQPGSILDVPPGQKYHFPIAGQSADKLGIVISTLLRACAARVSQPEFVFSMDASASNYASLQAAEVPGNRAFEVEQGWYAHRFRACFKRVIFMGILKGELPSSLLDRGLKYTVRGPAVKSRDEFSIARAREIERRNGILSRRTWAEQAGLDLDVEQQRREKDKDDEEALGAEGNVGVPGKGMDPQGDSAAG